MPIELTRTQLLFCVFIASAMILLFANRSSQPIALSTWGSRPLTAPQADAPPAITGQASIRSIASPSTSSVPLSMAGDVGFNILSALDASNGALRNVIIQPGETWSFNASIGNPAQVAIRTVGGVPGGGWCDLASRYVQAVRPLLAADAVHFVNHVTTSGIRIANVDDNDAVSIWNTDGRAGSSGQSQDLQITNTLAAPLHLQVLAQPNEQIIVQAAVR